MIDTYFDLGMGAFMGFIVGAIFALTMIALTHDCYSIQTPNNDRLTTDAPKPGDKRKCVAVHEFKVYQMQEE